MQKSSTTPFSDSFFNDNDPNELKLIIKSYGDMWSNTYHITYSKDENTVIRRIEGLSKNIQVDTIGEKSFDEISQIEDTLRKYKKPRRLLYYDRVILKYGWKRDRFKTSLDFIVGELNGKE